MRSCIMPGLPTDSVQELNVDNVSLCMLFLHGLVQSINYTHSTIGQAALELITRPATRDLCIHFASGQIYKYRHPVTFMVRKTGF